jgi:hypothetical protein
VGKSSNGPDMTDIAMMTGALETLHECRVSFTATTLGTGHEGILHLRLCATFNVLPGSSHPETVEVNSQWPNMMGTALEGTWFRGLYDLDFAIGEAYQQRFLPGVQ